MQYMIVWNERSQGSALEYERAQRRILDVFGRWQQPDGFKILCFVVRVGDWGGYMLAECDDMTEIHKLTSMLPAFRFEVRPVMPVEAAIRCELEVMDWRDKLTFD